MNYPSANASQAENPGHLAARSGATPQKPVFPLLTGRCLARSGNGTFFRRSVVVAGHRLPGFSAGELRAATMASRKPTRLAFGHRPAKSLLAVSRGHAKMRPTHGSHFQHRSAEVFWLG